MEQKPQPFHYKKTTNKVVDIYDEEGVKNHY